MTVSTRRGTSRAVDTRTAAREVIAAIAGPDTGLVIVYCAPHYDLPALAEELKQGLGDVPVIGCTTAGEITPLGYIEDAVTAVALCGGVTAHVERIDNLSELELESMTVRTRSALAALRSRRPDASPRNSFGLLLADGLARQEEALASVTYGELEGLSVCGGSAADGLRFGSTHVYHDGAFRTNCAILALVSIDTQFVAFKSDHFGPSTRKLVITGAEPAKRIVTEINGEPAAREYARVLGLQIDQLTPMVFAEHPVVVTLGGISYARSIQCVNPDESLSFFCAIDEGIVLTVAERFDLVARLDHTFADIRKRIGEPAVVLGYDCILRNLEIGQRGLREQVSEIFLRNNVVGFATYGEQYNGIHINQTFTGIAISGA